MCRGLAAIGTTGVLAREDGHMISRGSMLDAILEGLGDGVFIIDRNFQILEANSYARQIHGIEGEELKGCHCYEVSHGFDEPCWITAPLHHRCPVLEAMETGSVSRAVHIHNDGHGGVKYVELIAFPVKSPDGEVDKVVEIIRDITEQKLMEERIARVERLETIGTLAGGIAHDLNNILTPIMGNAEMAMMELGSSHPVRARLEAIFSAARRAATLIEHILAFSGRHRIETREVALNEVVENLMPFLKGVLPSSGAIELEFRPGQGLPSISADLAQLEEVLINLVVNARDAILRKGDGGAITIETSMVSLYDEKCYTCGFQMRGDHVRMSVTDDGEGMSDHVKARIFEPFFTTKEIGKGTGLGLAAVTGIVHQHLGHITCDSVPGDGTTFSIYFPAG